MSAEEWLARAEITEVKLIQAWSLLNDIQTYADTNATFWRRAKEKDFARAWSDLGRQLRAADPERIEKVAELRRALGIDS